MLTWLKRERRIGCYDVTRDEDKEDRGKVVWWIHGTRWGWKRVHDPRATIKITFLFMYC